MSVFGVEVTVRDGPTLRLDEPWHQHHSSRSSLDCTALSSPPTELDHISIFPSSSQSDCFSVGSVSGESPSLTRTSANVPLLSSSDSTIIKNSTSSSEAAAVPVNMPLMTTESLSSTMPQATTSTVVVSCGSIPGVVCPPHPGTTETSTTTEISILLISIVSSPTPSTSTPQSRIGIVERTLPGVAAGVVIGISLIIAGGVFFLCRRRSKIIQARQWARARSEFRGERRAGEPSRPADDTVILSRDLEAQEGSSGEGQEEASDNHGVYQHEIDGGSLLGTSVQARRRKLGILAIQSSPVSNASQYPKVRFSEPVIRVAPSRISTSNYRNPFGASMTAVTLDSNTCLLDSGATQVAPVNSRGYSFLRENGQAGGIFGTGTGEDDQESPSDSELRTPIRQAGTFGVLSRTPQSRRTRTRSRNRRDMNGPLAYELADLRRMVERLESRELWEAGENDAETYPLSDGNLSEELDISGNSRPPAYSPSSENVGLEGERVPAGTRIREVRGNGGG